MLFDDVIESVILIFSLDKHLIQCRFFQILKFFKFSLMKGNKVVNILKKLAEFFLLLNYCRKYNIDFS